jgi:hypothetical protein
LATGTWAGELTKSIAERFVRIRRRLGNGPGIVPNFLLENAQGHLELGIASLECSVRGVIHHHVGINAVPLNQPLAFGSVNAYLRRSGDSMIREEIVRAEPDLASSGAHADHFTQPEPLSTLDEGFAI